MAADVPTKPIFLPAYCARAYEDLARPFASKFGNLVNLGENKLLDSPDLREVSPEFLDQTRRAISEAWKLAFGDNHALVSLPLGRGIITSTKLLHLLYELDQKSIAIPSRLRRILDDRSFEQGQEILELETRLQRLIAHYEETEAKTYVPESVLQVMAAIQASSAGSGIEGVRGVLGRPLDLVVRSLDNYNHLAQQSASLDWAQFRMFTELSNWISLKFLDPSDPDIQFLIEELGIALIRTTVEPAAIDEAVERLLSPDDNRLKPDQKSSLQSLVSMMWKHDEMLKQARRQFAETFMMGRLALAVSSLPGRPDGRREIDLDNYLRERWATDLSGYYLVWVQSSAQLLNQGDLRHPATDRPISLNQLPIQDVFKRFALEPGNHALLSARNLTSDNLQAEFWQSSTRIDSLKTEIYQLEQRIALKEQSTTRTEKLATNLAKAATTGTSAFNNPVIAAPIMKTLVQHLVDESTAVDEKGNSVVPEVILTLPGNLSDFLKVVRMPVFRNRTFEALANPEDPANLNASFSNRQLTHYLHWLEDAAVQYFRRDIDYQQTTDPNADGQASASVDTLKRRNRLREEKLQLFQAVNDVLIAVRDSIRNDPTLTGRTAAKVRADAYATLGYQLVGPAPTLSRFLASEQRIPSTITLGRRVLIEILLSMVGQPELARSELRNTVSGWGTPLARVTEIVRRQKWRTWTMMAIVGAGVTVGALNYYWNTEWWQWAENKTDEIKLYWFNDVETDIIPQ